MDRERSRRFHDRDRRGDYRPGPRFGRPSPPRAGDSYVPFHHDRGPARRRSRSPEIRRRRSRSPTYNAMNNGPSWVGRPRSPRRWEPRDEVRRDVRSRTPPPERMVRPRSPFGSSRLGTSYSRQERSPLPLRRDREFSPNSHRGKNSPFPAKRERPHSPGYDRPRRPSSPPKDRKDQSRFGDGRNDRNTPPAGAFTDSYTHSHSPTRQGRRCEPYIVGPQIRRRSLSPTPRTFQSGQSSGRESTSTSRRSSPPIHPSRLALQQSSGLDTRSSTLIGKALRTPPKSTQEYASSIRKLSPPTDRMRSPQYRGRSALAGTPPRDSSGYRTSLRRSPPRRTPPKRSLSPTMNTEHGLNGFKKVSSSSIQLSIPGGQPGRSAQSAVSKTPPSGLVSSLRSNEPSAAISAPLGPASSPLSMSAHNRPTNLATSAPSRPRGSYTGQQFSRDAPRDGSFSGLPPGGARRAPSSTSQYHPINTSRGPPSKSSMSSSTALVSGGVPTGPRSSHPSGPPSHAHGAPFRSLHNSSSTTYPRTQRFTALANMPQIIPGGKLLPSAVDPKIAERLAKLDEEKRKLEAEVARMEEQNRSGLRDWDRLTRESNRESFKSELAEQHVSMLAGEGGMGGAAF